MHEDIVIKSIIDPDFGPLDLIETRTEGALGDGPMKPLVFRTWRTAGSIGGAPALLISCGDDTDESLHVSEAVRSDYRRYSSDLENLKAEVARRDLQLAKDWAAEGGIDVPLDAQTFASLLALEAYSIDPGRLTVWFRDTADIFAGHSVEVRIENGEIAEIGLAG